MPALLQYTSSFLTRSNRDTPTKLLNTSSQEHSLSITDLRSIFEGDHVLSNVTVREGNHVLSNVTVREGDHVLSNVTVREREHVRVSFK